MRVKAPIDDKHLMEDCFTEDVFQDFYVAPDDMQSGYRHLIGTVKTEDYDAYVEASWKVNTNTVSINVVGYQPTADLDDVRREVYEHYERVFKEWECEEHPELKVECIRSYLLTVSFYFETDD